MVRQGALQPLNGIPPLVSDRRGFPESCNGAGFYISGSGECRRAVARADLPAGGHARYVGSFARMLQGPSVLS